MLLSWKKNLKMCPELVDHYTKLSELNTAEHVSALLAQHPRADAWLPLRANNQDMVVLMHKASAEVVAIVDLRPWD